MPASHGTLNVVGDKAYVIASLPVAALRTDATAAVVQDGVLTAAELKAHEASLKAAVRAGLQVSAAGQAATVTSLLLNLPRGADHAHDRSSELTVMLVAQLAAPPQALSVRSTLWAATAQTLTLEATMSAGRQVLRREVAELTAKAPSHTFFGQPGEAPTPAKAHTHGPHTHTHGPAHTH